MRKIVNEARRERETRLREIRLRETRRLETCLREVYGDEGHKTSKAIDDTSKGGLRAVVEEDPDATDSEVEVDEP